MGKSYDLSLLKIQTKKIEQLHQMGIYTIQDLLRYYPSKYEIIGATNLEDQQKVTIEAKVISLPKIFYRGRLSRLSIDVLVDDLKEIKVTIFNRHFLKNKLGLGEIITIVGKYNQSSNSIVASNILLKGLDKNQGIYPVYSLKDELSQKSFRTYIKKALNFFKGHISEGIPLDLKIKYQLINRELALNLIHNPQNQKDIKEAVNYLKYEEFFKFQLTMQYLKQQKNQEVGQAKCFDLKIFNNLIKKLPFELTKDQLNCLDDICRDLKQPKMMYRFIQGDVGSGKTVVASLGLYANYLAGYQGAIMAPTEILANQHYFSLVNFFKDTKVKVALLTSHLKTKIKKQTIESLENGEIDIVVGTHALFQEAVKYNKLGLVVTDEQHRFGVNQRKALKNKGKQVDYLVMSATPIPRTLAMTLYGDLDISTIRTLPKGRKPIKTKVVKGSTMKPILSELKSYLRSGGQCYVVCPLVSESENYEAKDATSIYEAMKKYFKGTYNVGLIHGKMDDVTKEETMTYFKENKIQILVATTVIEVGVDVSNANMIIIYNADRFGLSQLHQLRGRVGRGEDESYCFLLSGSKSKEAIERLGFLEKSNDGFEISNYDLQIRGPGEILGNRQSGIPTFLLGDILEDSDMLSRARDDVALCLKSKEVDLVFKKLLEEVKEQLIENNQYVD